ncbi:MAG: type II toxin-antitoxin system mRNA interferase toxin, RelE/StbE family [bacterium]|nr:type II toxin-antitoxin system mRNA interferase toxin, RelE/StbE family [bacterium]
MRTLIWSATFLRTVKRFTRKRPEVLPDIEHTLRLLVQDPFTPKLQTHKLKGKLAGVWACSVGYDLRIIFDFVKVEKQKETAIFLIEIGSHDEVY